VLSTSPWSSVIDRQSRFSFSHRMMRSICIWRRVLAA
jgi:hypothetical protein